MSKLAMVLGAVAVLACAGSAGAATVTVHIFNFDFSPDPTISTGDTVHWVWDTGFHSTTSVAGISESWNSGAMTGPSFDHTFTHTGTFDYYCQIHGFDNGNGTAGGMSGAITVTPEPATLCLLLLGATAGILKRSRRTPAR